MGLRKKVEGTADWQGADFLPFSCFPNLPNLLVPENIWDFFFFWGGGVLKNSRYFFGNAEIYLKKHWEDIWGYIFSLGQSKCTSLVPCAGKAAATNAVFLKNLHSQSDVQWLVRSPVGQKPPNPSHFLKTGKVLVGMILGSPIRDHKMVTNTNWPCMAS